MSSVDLLDKGWFLLVWDLLDTSFEFGLNILDKIYPCNEDEDDLNAFALNVWIEEKRNILRMIKDRIFEEFPDASCDDIARQFGLSTYSVMAISKNRRGKAVMGWLYE